MDLKLLFLNLLLALQLRFGSFFETEKNGKIFGGKRIEINEVPWQVALEHVTKGFFCGGSILSESWILTAAHCVTVNLSEWFVRSGSSIRSKGGEVHKVIKIFIHPNYHEITYDILDYDFALLKIQNPINFDAYRQPIKLAEPHMYQQGDLVFASGFGETKNPMETDEFLKGTVLQLTGDSCCINIYPEMTRSMVCAKGQNAAICSGDSGGPLVSYKYRTLLGVSSFGYEPCNYSRIPDVFAKVSEAKNWIYLVLSSN